MQQELFFKTNSKIEKILGRELISNNSIAIFELIKNSYDAGAKNVTIRFIDFNQPSNMNESITNNNCFIEVEDDGKGMSFEDINNIWMELGTPDKNINKNQKVRVRKGHIETVVNRVVNGEKGIGRLGVDKIGAKLDLISTSLKSQEITEVNFDWNDFDDYSKQVNQVPCPYEVKENSSGQSGLKLIIKELRNSWSQNDIYRIKNNLKKFLSPVKNIDDDFNIHFEIKYNDSLSLSFVEKIENDTFDYLENFIEAEIDQAGVFKYKIKYLDKDLNESELSLNNPSFGALKVKLFYLDKQQKSVFTKKMGLKPSQYGSIKVFKDNFQVFPYGEPKNDWLGIDLKHSKGVYRTFSSQNLIGHVLLNDENNLQPLSSRIGLIEDTVEFKELTDFIWNVLEIFQNYIFEKLKNVAKNTSKYVFGELNNLEITTDNIIRNFTNIIEDIPMGNKLEDDIKRKLEDNKLSLQNHLANIRNASNELDKKLKVYEQITSKEGFLLSVIHTIKNKIGFLKYDISILERKIKKNKVEIKLDNFKRTFKSVDHLVDATLDNITITDKKKTKIDTSILIVNFLSSINSLAEEKNIDIIIENNDRVIIEANYEGMFCILDNLVDNSIKALESVSNKKIWINCTSNENYFIIYFKDNGIGIKDENKPFIFSLWSSKNEETIGTGMGLPTCKNIIESYSGDISLVEDRDTLFRIRLPKEI